MKTAVKGRRTGNKRHVIGLICESITLTDANEFFEEAKDKLGENMAKSCFYESGSICPDCLARFIKNNDIDLLFIDIAVKFSDAPIEEAREFIRYIGYLSDCDIYYVRVDE